MSAPLSELLNDLDDAVTRARAAQADYERLKAANTKALDAQERDLAAAKEAAALVETKALIVSDQAKAAVVELQKELWARLGAVVGDSRVR